MTTIEENKGYIYCKDAAGGKIPVPKYVKKQCREILPVLEDRDEKYTVNLQKLEKICKLLKALKMPKGVCVGKSLYSCLDGFQWLIIIASLCVVYRQERKKRRYTTVMLEIARKNGKTFIVAVLFILLFFFEPKYSWFYSVAPDGTLSREIKKAIVEIISYNARVFEMDKSTAFFKIRRDDILFKCKENEFVPLNYSNSRLDGKLPNVFICDEVGALPNSYAYEAMRSGQLTIINKIGFLISTKYPNVNNPWEDEVEYAKKVLDKKYKDSELFALLYEPDEPKKWMTSDKVIYHANPLALSVPLIFEDLKKKRKRAISVESARENFLCKHCNIIYQGFGTESYVPITAVKACSKKKISFEGMSVYIGVDLSMSNDNCSVCILGVTEDEKFICDVYAFIPEGRIEEKNKFEGIDYHAFIRAMKCIACGDLTVDYKIIEDFVFEIERKFNCSIAAIGYDRFNAMSSAQKWDRVFNTVQIRQHSDTLHPPTKLLYEKIMNGEFAYEENKLLEANFENAKCTFDTNLNRYVNKKKSKGKVDMVVSIINAVYLAQQDIIFDDGFIATVV